MNTTKIFVFTLFSAIIFSACEKTIDFKSGEIAPRMVVNSVFVAGSKYKYVRVEKSRSILNDNEYFESLPNANVKLYEDGEFITELAYMSVVDTFVDQLEYGVVKEYPYEAGYYLDSAFTVKSGSTYRLEVSGEGFEPVFCETTVPYPVKLNSLDFEIEKTPSDNYNLYAQTFNLNIADSKSEDNYYRIQVTQTHGIELSRLFANYYGYGYGGSAYADDTDTTVTDTIVQQLYINSGVNSNDPVLTRYSNGDLFDSENDFNSYSFFTDELMGSEDYNLSFWLTSVNEIRDDLGEYIDATATVLNISKELYYYSRSKTQQSNAIDNAFAEPVPVYSNVNGGMGIFGSEAASSLSSLIGRYPLEDKIYITREKLWELYYGY